MQKVPHINDFANAEKRDRGDDRIELHSNTHTHTQREREREREIINRYTNHTNQT